MEKYSFSLKRTCNVYVVKLIIVGATKPKSGCSIGGFVVTTNLPAAMHTLRIILRHGCVPFWS